MARLFVEARSPGVIGPLLPLLDPDLVASLQQLLHDVHAADRSSLFAQSLKDSGETEPLVPLLTMLFGPVKGERSDPSDRKVEALGRVEGSGPDAAVVLIRTSLFLSRFPKALAFSELSAVSVVRRGKSWFVRPPGGEHDLQVLRAMVSGGLIANRDGSLTESVELPHASPGTVSLVSIVPAASSLLTRDAVITAELDYDIEQFEPGRFQASAQVTETQADRSTMGTGAPYEQPMLPAARGKVQLVFPALAVWDMPEVRRPFEIRFCIQQLVGRLGASVTVACTAPVTYRVSAPAARLASPRGVDGSAIDAIEVQARRPSAAPEPVRPMLITLSTPAMSPARQDRQATATARADTAASVARRFLEAAAAGDLEQCSMLLDPDAVRQLGDDLRRIAADKGDPGFGDQISSAGNATAAGLLVGLALSGDRHDPAGATVEVVGTVAESPTSTFVVYRSSRGRPDAVRVPLSELSAVHLLRKDEAWRVTTPSGATDSTTLLASLRVLMSVASAASEAEKLSPAPPSAGVPSADEAAVRAVAFEWRRAKIAHDIATLDRLMTPDFVEVNQAGERLSRVPVLRLYRSADLEFAGIDVERMVVEVAGDRARATGVHNERVSYRGRAVGGRVAFTEIYVRTAGHWQLERSELRRVQ